jgi:competence protein ComEC
MSAMTGVSEWFTQIPGSYFYVPAPSWISIGIYYAILIAALGGWLKTARRKIAFAAALTFIAAFYLWQWDDSRGEVKLTVLPLNGGHAVFVDAAGRKNDWLIDCGDENAVNFTLKNFLRAQGVNKISRLVLTEGDSQNCGGAELLGQLFGVGELWTSPVHFRSAAYNEIVGVFEKSSRHKTFSCGDQAGCWQILWPAATNNFSRADDSALVLLGDFSGAKILLLSDLNRAGQSGLLTTTNDLRADIVVAGLPNEGEPLSDALIDAIQPKIIVIADSEYPANRRASSVLKERLAQKGIPTIYTRGSGATTILVNKRGWQLRAMDGQKFSSDSSSK